LTKLAATQVTITSADGSLVHAQGSLADREKERHDEDGLDHFVIFDNATADDTRGSPLTMCKGQDIDMAVIRVRGVPICSFSQHVASDAVSNTTDPFIALYYNFDVAHDILEGLGSFVSVILRFGPTPLDSPIFRANDFRNEDIEWIRFHDIKFSDTTL